MFIPEFCRIFEILSLAKSPVRILLILLCVCETCSGVTGGITTLLVCGVTTEVCVHTTIREGNDRGYRCVAVSDCCASYFDEFHDTGLRMIKAQGGIFGWVTDSVAIIEAEQMEERT